ncbi:hypothetical protein ASPZODRAFT_131758 [Penicilliopsis zonata CBS 506.65]|uniref:TauD/TfdA-like domain-containing protein n=1 Tax=Penicilliopsis zonata CBS 506.65 TaxID=1073090 RepID=A0A1L9SIF2_9EURO|nr:hypothetical protein ASPZODRAFT_131758 [Penicilliopsis zonata CBS 506.65]OJJ46863.1 hypothetical protein ASPZODRAFT_131758 [Penicilliopsis zonata CBS 506.65]
MAMFSHRRCLVAGMAACKRLNYRRHYANVSELASVPQLAVHSQQTAHDQSHLQTIHHHLHKDGILKLGLTFSDDTSSYLQQLIMNLHRHHSHGLPITHSAERGWFWDVRPSPDSFQSNNVQARSETMEEFPWHTDCSYESAPPRFFALQVLQPDRCGGGTLSVLKVEKLLGLLSASTRRELAKAQFEITVPEEFVKESHQRVIVGSVLGLYDDKNAGNSSSSSSSNDSPPVLRFRDDIFTPLTSSAEAALAELKSVMTGAEAERATLHLTAQMMPRGSVILLDNGRWLHARNEVKDPARHLRRVRWDARKLKAGEV